MRNMSIPPITHMLTIFGVLLALAGIGATLYVSEPATLNVTHEVDQETERLIINVTNEAYLKSSGTLNFFRLDVDHSKPHMQLESLRPSQTAQFDLSIEIEDRQVLLPTGIEPEKITCTVEAEYYFATEDSSIGYQLTCDNCPSQGIIGRIPRFQAISVQNIHYNETLDRCVGTIPIYRWTEVGVNELRPVESIQ